MPLPARTPFATPPKAPLRGQGPAVQTPATGEKPDFTALAKARVGAAPQPQAQPRISTPMSGPAPAAPAPQKGERGYMPPKSEMDMAREKAGQQKYGYANPGLNDPSIREAALQRLQAKQQAKQNEASAGTKFAGMGTGGDAVNPFAASGDQQPTYRTFTEEQKAAAKAREEAKAKLSDKTKPIFGSVWDDKSGSWVPQTTNTLPPGVDENTPGVFYDPEHNEWTYDPEGGADKAAIDAQLEKALTSKPEDYAMSPEMLAANSKKIAQQGSEAKAKLSQQLAGRGLGASGLAGAGFGNIDVGTINAQTDLATQNFQTGVEARINELKALLTAHGNELSEKNRVEIAKQIADAEKAKFEYEKASQKEADAWNAGTNILAQAGASEYTPAAWAWVFNQIEKGTNPADVAKMLVKDDNGILRLDPKYAPPPPTWDKSMAEWRKLTDAEMDQAWVEWKQGGDYGNNDTSTSKGA